MKKRKKEKVAEELAGLQQAFKHRLPGIIVDIERVWTCLPRGDAQGSSLASLHRITLNLLELSSVIGADGIMEAARVLERRLRPLLDLEESLAGPASKHIDTLVSRLRLEAGQWQQQGDSSSPLTEALLEHDEGSSKPVLLVGDHASLVTGLIEAGYQAQHIPELSDLAHVCEQLQPSAVVVGLAAYADSPGEAIQAVAGVWEEVGQSIPLLLACNGVNMETCLAAVRKGPIRFTKYPPDLATIKHDIEDLIPPQTDRPCRVLLVNEHEILLKYYGLILQCAGMRAQLVNDPLQAQPAIERFRPDVIVVEEYMTACSGMEFRLAINSTSESRCIPVVFLSWGLSNHGEIRDDGGFTSSIFLEKPVAPGRLVSEVIRLAHQRGMIFHLEQELSSVIRDKNDFQAAMNQHAIVSVTDTAGRITYINEKFCEISGYSANELLGENHRILKSGLHDKTFYKRIWDTIANGKIWHGEICNRRKNGEYYWVEASIVPVKGEDGSICRYISLRTDITKIKEDELAALGTSRRLQAQQKLLVRLAAEPALNDQDPELFFRHLTRYASENMGVGRVGLWVLDESRRSLVCRILFQARDNTFVSGCVLDLSQCPVFLAALKSRQSVVADDVHEDSPVHELFDSYLRTERIGAVLYVPVLYRGENMAVLCIEYVGGARCWMQDERSFASALAALAAQRLEIQERIEAEAVIEKQKRLLTLLNSAMTEFIAKQEIEQVTDHLLKGVLELTGSEYGFAGEIHHTLGGVPDFRLHALSQLKDGAERSGIASGTGVMRFHNLDTLFGETIRKGEVVISNEPSQDPRHRGLPEGHPPLTSYLGVPIYYGANMVAMYSLANRRHGYDRDLMDFLQPFNTTYGVLVEAARIDKRGQLAQQALLEAKEEADNANRAKSQFLSNMSHELRTPLNAIMGFGQLLQMDMEYTLTPAQRDSVEEILSASRHLLDLINEVLDLTRIEVGRIDLNMENIAIVDLLDECLRLVAPQAQERNIDVHFKRGSDDGELLDTGDRDCLVRADRTRLKQALLNLLSNAIKYNKENGEVDITYSCRANGCFYIAIRDTGPGIPKDRRSQLFQAFNRLGLEQSDIEGTGIGLVITKKIIELMGGSIGVESKEGEGAIFWLEIPGVLQREDQRMGSEDDHGDILRQTHIKKILYMENNTASIRLVTHILGHMPHVQLITANDMSQGLVLVEKHRPSLILLNINLHDIDGYEALAVLREQLADRDVPVVAIGASGATPEEIGLFREAGFLDYIPKPIETESLIRVVNRALLE